MHNEKSFHFGAQGYYICLIVCAAIVATAGLILRHRTAAQAEEPISQLSLTEPTAAVMSPQPLQAAAVPTEPEPEPDILRTASPMTGEAAAVFSVDALCFNPTTRDWRIHDGMDLAAEEGTPVLAAADGTVSEVYSDDQLGSTVVIRHKDGYVTQYSSLAADIPVVAGQQVSLGDPIGCCSESAAFESALGPHIHFSVTCNGEPVDPETFLNQS